MRIFRTLTGVFAFVLISAGMVRAQGVGNSGAIRGTVSDPTGASIAKATIVAEEPSKGIRRTAISDDSGAYEITGLPPSTYQLTVKISGFQTELQKDVAVSIGQIVVVDFRMKLSSGNEVVEVNTEPPMVETERGHLADTVSEQYITDLPIDRRDYLTFTLLMPGVSDSTRLAGDQDFRVKQTPQSGLSFYGSNGRGNSVTVDGGEANDDSGGVRLTLSQEAVQEFQINRSNYSAELGGASGAAINIVSKTGTNQIHGSVYGFFRNDVLDAADPFAKSQALQPGDQFNPAAPDLQGTNIKNSQNRQQFGGSLGLPVKKDKTFLFASFEGLRQDAQNAVPILTNTNIFRPNAGQVATINGLATETGNPNVPCLTPPGQPVVVLPAQTCAFALNSILTVNANPGGNPFVSPGQAALNGFIIGELEANGGVFPYNTHRYQTSVRLDHHLNDQNEFFLRYNYSHDLEESPDVQSLTGFTRGSSIHAYDNTIQGAWYHLFSQSMQNALQVQFNYSTFDVIPNVPGEVGLDIPGYASLGTQIFIPSLTIMRRPEVSDSFTMIHGHHTLKFGGEFLYRGNHTESHTFFPGRFVFGNLPGAVLSPCLLPSASASSPNPCGLVSQGGFINSLQSVSLGVPQFYEQGFGNPNYDYPRPFGALFWQDTWKIAQNFTLNFGLRYEIDGQYGPLGTDKDNFAPRVSFAWDPFKNHKTVVRGGFGIFYSQIYGQIADVIQTLGNVNNTRQIANLLAPASINAPCPPAGVSTPTIPLSACIFQTLFAQGKVSCKTPAAGEVACITAADLAQFGITVSNTGPLPLLTVIFSGQPGYQNPYSEQASFGIEREIANGFSVSLSGIYSHTLRLPVAIDINAVPQPFQLVTEPLANGKTVTYRNWNSNPLLDPIVFFDPTHAAPCAGAKILQCFVNPGILQADQYSSQASALYEGGIIEVKKRFSDNFTLLGNYTYSKGFDTSTDFNSDFGPQDNTSLGIERALSDFDQRHKFTAAAVIESPWKNAILSGFELSPIVRYNSGHPFNLLAGSDVNGDRHSTNDRPIGAGRNTGLGPDYTAFDMRLSRLFKLGEKANLQLIAEGFNLANHTNFASVNNVVGLGYGLPTAIGGAGATTFHVSGTSAVGPSQPLGFTSALPKREIQLGLRLSF
ncbi:MAG TPA: carboxypeptidase regulatory-like domain-containing protein [Candidatus Acidoferrum sp.]|nr:carboxypeptidase regulatory-like domain-containing protein [Candidatus Acidoferrum sp.]